VVTQQVLNGRAGRGDHRLAARGYPTNPEKGAAIGCGAGGNWPTMSLSFTRARTADNEGRLRTPWPRVSVTGLPHGGLAAQASRRAAERISFDGKTMAPRHRLA